MKRVAPLNMVKYDKDEVKQFLHDKFDWTPYDNKHYEDIFTRFYEGYYLIHKFLLKYYLSGLNFLYKPTKEAWYVINALARCM